MLAIREILYEERMVTEDNGHSKEYYDRFIPPLDICAGMIYHISSTGEQRQTTGMRKMNERL